MQLVADYVMKPDGELVKKNLRSRRHERADVMIPKFFQLLLAALFLWAAYAKATMTAGGPTMYEQWLESYPSTHYLLPAAEVVLGLWLLVGILPRGAALISMSLVSGFSGLLILEIFREHPKPCGCMGAIAAIYEPSAIRWSLAEGIGRNILMIAGCVYIYLRADARARAAAPAVPELANRPAGA